MPDPSHRWGLTAFVRKIDRDLEAGQGMQACNLAGLVAMVGMFPAIIMP